MPNFTMSVPPKLSGNAGQDLIALKEWGTALADELSYLFSHLDAGNVAEAASVKAENINTNSAKITNAQIGELTADKLVTGSVDTSIVTIHDKSGTLTMTGSAIQIGDGQQDRFIARFDKTDGTFTFALINDEGDPTVYIDDGGNAIFTGTVESSNIFSTHMIGTSTEAYQQKEGGVFADINPTGIKIMQDKNHVRNQKLGLAVGNDGTAYIILGAGDGTDAVTINGVTYTNGTFNIQKFNNGASMGIVGSAPFISFWQNSGNINIDGTKVLINGMDVVEEIRALKNTGNTVLSQEES